MNDGLLIVGGGPAGHATALAYRNAGGEGPVRLLTADARPPYNRPPLSKDFLRGESESSDLPLATDDLYRSQAIDVLASTEVATLDLADRAAVTGDGIRYRYNVCVLATGASAATLPCPGTDHPDVLSLRSFHDASRLRDRCRGTASAVVIGSGFVGCEAAASLALSGTAVTMISMEAAPQCDRLGAYAAERIRGWLGDRGVRLVFNAGVDSVTDGHVVHLDDGSTVEADLLLSAAGAVPNCEVALAAGLAIEDGRVLANSSLRTSDRSVWCAGDVVLGQHETAGRRLAVEHWGDALAMGEIAGHNAAGGHPEQGWTAVPGFWSEIGDRVLKYATWGDGFDEAIPVEHRDGAFTVWFAQEGTCVGVLTHRADDDYDKGIGLIAAGSPAFE